jgi:hypothetical protein
MEILGFVVFGFVILALGAAIFGYGHREVVSNNNFTHQKRTPSSTNDLYHLEISFLEAIRGATKTVHFWGTPPVDIIVPPNSSSGDTVRVPGRGGEGGDGVPRDALIKLTVKPHPRFERRGLDISLDAWASVRELAAGTTIDVETLHGYAKVSIRKGTRSGQVLRLPGKGVTCSKTGSIGHQFVRVLAREEATRPWEREDPWHIAHAEQSARPLHAANKAQSQPHSAQANEAVETEFRSVFFSRTSADRERIISYWMQKRDVDRTEAMRLAIDDWRKDTRAGR